MQSFKNLRLFMKNPIELLDEKFSSESSLGVQKIKIGPKRFILVFDPEIAHEVLLGKDNTFVQNRVIFDRIKPITGEKGLVQLNGKSSEDTRRKFMPMFTPQNLAKMKEQILVNTEEALAELRPNTEIEIASVMADLVLRNAFKLFLGLDIKHEAKEMAEEFQELNSLCGERMISLFPMPLAFPTSKNKRIKYLRSSLRLKIAAALRSNNPDNSSINIHKLFQNDDTLIDQCMTFLFAGHETTASSLSFTFLLLGNHPEYRKRIVAGDEGLALMVYKEALRLYPPAYMLVRQATREAVLGGVEVKKGDQVIIGVKQIHRHPSFHQSPALFVPERFKESSRAFLPFGAGSKDCIGEGVAYIEALTIIKSFCKSFDFTSHQKDITSFPLVTLHPGAGQYLSLSELSHG
jgi:cytochrome P450